MQYSCQTGHRRIQKLVFGDILRWTACSAIFIQKKKFPVQSDDIRKANYISAWQIHWEFNKRENQSIFCDKMRCECALGSVIHCWVSHILAVVESRPTRSGWLNRKWSVSERVLQRRAVHYYCTDKRKRSLNRPVFAELGSLTNDNEILHSVGAFTHRRPRDDSRIRCAQVLLPGENININITNIVSSC